MKKLFDLNIEKILENWELNDAVREIISNAIDESVLSNSKKQFEIKKTNGQTSYWSIRDYGRGIKDLHLTQNENNEKKEHDKTIGKFGIGLKDALAVFHKHKVDIEIISKHNIINQLCLSKKNNFDNIETIHVAISKNSDKNFVGTEFKIFNIDDKYIEKAKQNFLCFSNQNILATNLYGQIIENSEVNKSYIYYNGLKIAEEENYTFSYNITKPNAKLKKSLNRERKNIGKSAFSEIIQKIILNTKEKKIIKKFINYYIYDSNENLNKNQIEELKWKKIRVFIFKEFDKLPISKDYVFVNNNIIKNDPNYLVNLKEKTNKIIVIENHEYNDFKELEKNKSLQNICSDVNFILKSSGNLNVYPSDLNSFSKEELKIYNCLTKIIDFFAKETKLNSKKLNSIIKIVDKLENPFDKNIKNAVGLICFENNCIYILRKTLSSLIIFSSTVIHELIHYSTGFVDNTREFENELTWWIGKLITKNNLLN